MLFQSYCVIKIDNSRFQLIHEEDINRLICYFLTERTIAFSPKIKSIVKDLLLLKSSCTIATAILNSIQSPLYEYTFFQFYQCIEYLFKLNNCFLISKTHNLPTKQSLDIILENELKISESENLYRVLINNASEETINKFIAAIPQLSSDVNDKFKKTSEYIYRLRCNIAHLRYDQDDTSDIDWKLSTEVLIDVIYSIYQKLDEDIIQVNIERKRWSEITI